jgi:hypothetical protein
LDRKKADDGCTSGLTGTLSGSRFGASSLKEEAVVAVREKPPQKKLSHKKMKLSTTLKRRKGGTPVGYSRQTALRREQGDM